MTDYRAIRYGRLRETLYEKKLENGLAVYVLPKAGYRQTFASFTTRYGSFENDFVDAKTGVRTRVPDGIAHFLEHKMFEEEDGDVFNKFARYGAQANAFTTFDSTTYLFSSTEHVKENLDILLDFVQNPYFTDENVEKEKGIIGQEIRMYEDNPNWRVYFGLLQGFYGDYPAAIDIAGTIESIGRITKEDLYRCYHTFYHPSNMMLFVVGNADPREVFAWVEANQGRKSYGPQAEIERFYPPLPAAVKSPLVESRLAISQPRVLFGYKEARVDPTPAERSKREAAMEMWMDAYLGRGSALFHALIEDGLTDQGFSTEYELTAHYGHSIFGGNSKQPEKLVERVQKALQDLLRQGLNAADFTRAKRKAMGRFVALLDSPQGIAHVYTAQKLRGIDLFESLDELEQLTVDEVNQAIRDHLRPDQFAVSIVRPQE